LRVVCWNIERGYEPRAIVDRLAALDADLYLLTELDRGNARTAGVDMFAELEAGLGMPGLFALEFEELPSLWRRIIPQGGPGGGVHGNAVFSRVATRRSQTVALPTSSRLRWQGETWIPELFEPRRGGRVAQLVELELDGRPLTAINLHLESWRSDFSHRSGQIERALAACPEGPKVLAGDLNPLGGLWASAWPWRRVPREVAQLRAWLAARGFTDPFADRQATFRRFGLSGKLDWLACSPELEPLDWGLLPASPSDHACLWVDLAWCVESRERG
jgi:endonuclease/exonuclease/phosphatase family metal-dependent hydrolase